MNLKFKRSASFLLALVMLFSLFPAFGTHAHAEDTLEEPPVRYTVRFLDEDGTELQSSLVDAGAKPEYTGEPLYKEGYAFANWTPELAEVTVDADYTAVYTAVQPASEEPSEEPQEPSEEPEVPEEPEVTTYTITFLNHDGTLLEEVTVEEGKTPVYGGETPVKAEDETNTYAFSGWTPALAAASADAAYTAVFTATAKTPAQPETPAEPEDPETPQEPETKQYAVTFLNWDDSVLATIMVDEGEVMDLSGGEPLRNDDGRYIYKFAGWDVNGDGVYDENVDVIPAVTADATYKAVYYRADSYAISFASLTDTNLTYTRTSAPSDTSYFTENVSDDSITVTVSGWTLSIPFVGVVGTYSNSVEYTLTNNSGSKATLSFDYALDNGGSMTIDGKNATSGSYSAVLENTGKVTINVTSKAGKGNTTTASFTNIKLTVTQSSITTTFKSASNGSYTVDGTPVGASGYTGSKGSTESYAVKATAAANYQFFGWYNETASKYISHKAEDSLTITEAATVYPVFIDASLAIFGVGANNYYNLTDADNAAKNGAVKQINLLNDGTVSGSHTISSGNTLLIPFDTNYKLYGEDPETIAIPDAVKAPECKVFRKLTLAANTKITVKGAIEVGAKHYCSHGGKTFGGIPVDGYGQIEMGSGSNITLEGGKLYAWGYVTGSGSVTAKSGSTIYEKMQVSDYNGGSFTTDIVAQDVFPFNQYYIQNVEVPEVIESGANLICHATIYAKSLLGSIHEHSIDFMAKNNAMFTLSSGSITKHYDVDSDRLILDVNGNVSMNAIEIMEYNTSDFVLPFNHNITVNINSGTATVNQDIMMQPGAQMNIAKGAALSLAANKNVYMMDAASWGNFCFKKKMAPVTYVGSRGSGPKVTRSLTDSGMNIDGSLILNGQLYAASNAVKITSTGKSGSIGFNTAAPAASTIKQCDVSSGEVVAVNLNVAAPYLTHGDKTQLNTSGTAAGTTYAYCADHDCWYTGTCHYTVTFDSNGGTGTMNAVTVKKAADGDTTYTLPACTFTRTGYDFEGWDAGTTITINSDTTVKATWTPKTYTITFDSNGGSGNMAPVSAEYGDTYTLPACTFTRDGYNFVGWTVNGASKQPNESISITGPTTVKAEWTAQTYEVKWMSEGNQKLLEEVAFGTELACKLDNQTKASDETFHYKFSGWSTTEGATTAVSFPYTITGATTFYAIFTPVEHDFTNGDCECGTPAPAPAGLKGDVNLDEVVDLNDTVTLAQHVGEVRFLIDATALANADIDGNGEVNLDDLVIHAQYVGEVITEWPEG